MGKRLLTSAVGIALFFAVVLSGRFVLYTAVTVLVLGMVYEMYRVMCVGRFLQLTGYFSALLICAGFAFGKMLFAIVASLIIFMLAMIAMHGKVTSKKVLSVGFMTIAIAVLMCMLFVIRRKCDKYTVMLPFVCAWLTDTGAYMFGSLFGKHKLAENISPNKTVEGAIGGLFFSTIGSVLYIYIMVAVMIGKTPILPYVIKFALLGFFASVISQLGDLSASCIKRDFEKKDYGKILPGHGGLLDRFDSVLFAIPFVYYAMRHFIL
jgi:phosphatidate cytidylyltransferase